MTSGSSSWEEASIPGLLRLARHAYSTAMRAALARAGYGDMPKNGPYVLGGLARRSGERPLGELIEELRLSKQAAGHLVDALVVRGYLERHVDSGDRRRLTIGLTERGRAAAAVLGAARRAVDRELRSRVGTVDIERTLRTLGALADIARASAERQGG